MKIPRSRTLTHVWAHGNRNWPHYVILCNWKILRYVARVLWYCFAANIQIHTRTIQFQFWATVTATFFCFCFILFFGFNAIHLALVVAVRESVSMCQLVWVDEGEQASLFLTRTLQLFYRMVRKQYCLTIVAARSKCKPFRRSNCWKSNWSPRHVSKVHVFLYLNSPAAVAAVTTPQLFSSFFSRLFVRSFVCLLSLCNVWYSLSTSFVTRPPASFARPLCISHFTRLVVWVAVFMCVYNCMSVTRHIVALHTNIEMNDRTHWTMSLFL